MDEWTEALEEGKTIDCVYMDFMKAFDVVPHRKLLLKLRLYGFSNVALKWIQEFITGGTQRVRIDGILSDEEFVRSGIPEVLSWGRSCSYFLLMTCRVQFYQSYSCMQMTVKSIVL